VPDVAEAQRPNAIAKLSLLERALVGTEMELFNVITRLAFGATMTFAGVLFLCEQLLYYLS
jgi:hypothetical protein